MLQIRFKHANGCHLDENELYDEDLSGGILIVRRNNTEFQRLSELLLQTAGKLETVWISGIIDTSPEYLAFLVTACRKANAVQLVHCSMNDSIYACLMSSLIYPEGIIDLNIKLRGQMVSPHQARTFFQGVALSSSLQKLQMMWFNFEEMEDSVTAFEDAFKRNRSLKSFSLYLGSMPSDLALENVVRAATGNTTLETLNIIFQHDQHGGRRLSVSFLQECLCRETCSIQKLKLEGVVLDGDLGDNKIKRNSLLVDVRLPLKATLTCSQAVRFAKSFSSLTHFYVNVDPSSELVPLDEVLLGEEATLQDLTVVVEPKSGMVEHHWAEFFQKLPRMKSLKRLDFPRWIFFQSESCRSAFLDALRRNRTITKIIPSTFECIGSEEEPYFVDLYWKMSYLLSLNKGGRQFLQHNPSGQPLARNLWPHVLERALGIKYVSSYEISKYPKLGSLEIDVVYWLLRENLFT